MIRSRFVQCIAMLAVTFVVGPTWAADPPIEGKVDDSKQMVDLLKRIEQRLGVMEARVDTTLDLVKDLKQVREDVNRLQREVADLRRASSGNSTSNYPTQSAASPSMSAAVVVPAQPARVRLVNNYFTDMTATINGTTFLVPAFRTGDVQVTAGPLTYQVYQAGQPMKMTSIAPNEVVTLTLFPG